MKPYMKIQQITFERNEKKLFETPTLMIQRGDIIGVIGKNGSGKTTLLDIVSGRLSPTSGIIQFCDTDLQIAYVQQEQTDFVIEEIDKRVTAYENLSGGEKIWIRLVDGLQKSADILLLDEPTNHLDQEAMQKLVQAVQNYKGAVIIVSHNRYFLDLVVNKIWAIEDGKIISHVGNYTSYQKMRKKKRQDEMHQYEVQQANIKRIEAQLKNLSSWSDKAHRESTKQEGYKEFYRKKAKRMDRQVKSKRKRLEKDLEKHRVHAVKPEYEVQFTIPEADKRGNRLLQLQNVCKSYGSRMLFQNVNLTMQAGEKIALMGPNGCGKTTFLNLLLGYAEGKGEIWISPTVKIGYLTQTVFDLPEHQKPEEYFYRPTFEEQAVVRNLMNHLGFSKEQWAQTFGEMSMGERVKCKLMQYLLEKKDLLILDEPTNHLDLPSRERLEEALKAYQGAILVVSHDSYFIRQTTTKKWMFENDTIVVPSEAKVQNNDEMERLKLQNEQQRILGALSMLLPTDEKYQILDQKFLEICKKLREME